MKTSARNHFNGCVKAIRLGAVNDEIELELPGGEQIVATITHESTLQLGLHPGREAFALIKASWVILCDIGGTRTSARNAFRGTVRKIARGAVNSEVVLELDGGAPLVAIVTNTSVDELALREGEPAGALFKASHVIVGVQ